MRPLYHRITVLPDGTQAQGLSKPCVCVEESSDIAAHASQADRACDSHTTGRNMDCPSHDVTPLACTVTESEKREEVVPPTAPPSPSYNKNSIKTLMHEHFVLLIICLCFL